jgi:hypothetical protein
LRVFNSLSAEKQDLIRFLSFFSHKIVDNSNGKLNLFQTVKSFSDFLFPLPVFVQDPHYNQIQNDLQIYNLKNSFLETLFKNVK